MRSLMDKKSAKKLDNRNQVKIKKGLTSNLVTLL